MFEHLICLPRSIWRPAHEHYFLPRLRSGHGGQEPSAPWILLCSNLSIVTWIFFIVFPCGLLSNMNGFYFAQICHFWVFLFEENGFSMDFLRTKCSMDFIFVQILMLSECFDKKWKNFFAMLPDTCYNPFFLKKNQYDMFMGSKRSP
jgi:hypothetical protein